MQRRITEKILLVVSAAFFFASIFGWYGSTLPEYYESKTTLTLKPPQISGKVIANLTEEELGQRLTTTNQEILSNSSLETIISKYKLFEFERASGMPIELVIEKIRRNILVEVEKEQGRIVAGFSLTYRDTSPERARNVAAELARKYVSSQTLMGIEGIKKQKEFLQQTLEKAEGEFKKIKKERSKLKPRISREIEIKYQTAKDELDWIKKKQEIQSMQVCRGECLREYDSIRIVDPANLPKSAKFPTRLDFVFISAGFGFLVGLSLLGLNLLVNFLRNRVAKIELQ
jgi:uncharacterized protein involved in exopolysaccharide biosynthesis